jgi:DNA-binding NarL/FixJ family response regulator
MKFGGSYLIRRSLDAGSRGARPIRVLVVDDDNLTRVGLRTILEFEDDIEVVGEAASAADARRLCLQLRPDVVLMDVQLPDVDGIEATRRIVNGAGGSPKVIVLTTFDFEEYLSQAMAAGASGFLLKREPAEDVVAAVFTVAGGDALPTRDTKRRLITGLVRRGPRLSATMVGRLTKREADVLLLLARGLSNQEIAADLGLSEETVRTHVKHVYVKIGVRDRAQAVIIAYESGLVRRAS